MEPLRIMRIFFSINHLKRISFIGIFGVNAISQTLVSAWIASQNLKTFTVFALITGLGNLLAFLDFGTGTIAQTNYIRYLKSGSLKSLFFVKIAIRQSLAISGLICFTGTALLVLSKSSNLNLVAIYLILLGVTIPTNLAVNLIYAYGRSEIALLLSRSSWFWTLFIVAIFRSYFAENLSQVSLIAVSSQILCGIFAVIFCNIKKLLDTSHEFDKNSQINRASFLRDYRSLAFATGLSGIPNMVSLYADRYIISFVNGSSNIASLAAYGSLFSGAVGILNYLYYKERAQIEFFDHLKSIYQVKKFVIKVSTVCFIYFLAGQFTIYLLYPEQISNLYIHLFYSLALLSTGLSLGLQMRSVSIDYQRVIVRSFSWQSIVNITLTFVLAYFIGAIAGPLSTLLAILFVQIPILYFSNIRQ